MSKRNWYLDVDVPVLFTLRFCPIVAAENEQQAVEQAKEYAVKQVEEYLSRGDWKGLLYEVDHSFPFLVGDEIRPQFDDIWTGDVEEE